MFDPRWWTRDHQAKLVFIVREKVKNMEVLYLNDSGIFTVRDLPKVMERDMSPIDRGDRQTRKMKSTIRRIAKKPGTPKKAREAVKLVLAA